MLKLLFALLLLTMPLTTHAQRADSLAASYLNSHEWFKLRTLYERDSLGMSELIRKMSGAMLAHVFGHRQEAVRRLDDLLHNHVQELGFGNIYSFVSLLADNYHMMGHTSRAAAIMQEFVRQIDGKVNAATVEEYRQRAGLYKELSQRILYKTDGRSTYHLPFKFEEMGDPGQSLFMMQGSVNNTSCSLCFDTGASFNVASKEAAEQMGLRLIGPGLTAQGTTRIEGMLAIADSISIGDMVMRNVPFVVIDLMKDNEIAASILGKLSFLMGQPFLSRFAHYTIDIENQLISLHTDTLHTTREPNLSMLSTLKVLVNKGNDSLSVTLDSGAASTFLGTSYYKDYKKEVVHEGKWDIIGGAGAGGTALESVFRLPRVRLSIDGKPFVLTHIPVTALTDRGNNLTTGYGRLGTDFFRLWKKVDIDNINMRIELQ